MSTDRRDPSNWQTFTKTYNLMKPKIWVPRTTGPIMHAEPDVFKLIVSMCSEVSIMKLLSCCKALNNKINVPNEQETSHIEDISTLIKDHTYQLLNEPNDSYDYVDTDVTYIAHNMPGHFLNHLYATNGTGLRYYGYINHGSYEVARVKNAKSCNLILNLAGDVIIDLEGETCKRKGDHKDSQNLMACVNAYDKTLSTVGDWSITKQHSHVKCFVNGKSYDLIVFTSPFVYHTKQ